MHACATIRTSRATPFSRRQVRASAAAAPAKLAAMAPLGTRLLVKPEESTGVTSGGLVLPGSAKDESAAVVFGEVIAAGPDAKGAGAGEKVIFAKFSCTEVEFEGQPLFFVEDKSILATLE
eukprot:jgi/Pico_ML_1/55597/g1263.t1